ncbi:right-handed parallel beta-helix repeat-containing protein, partial [Candidatus Woesearchaeota archaeon]|nr:right-handed parallel beta-helix repeat-containing protein [Candidatus Woesearchaeota archaeon]
SNVTIKNCHVGGTSIRVGAGILLGTNIATDPAQINITISHNNISWRNRGIDYNVTNPSNLANITISNNTLFNVSREGIRIGGNNITISRNAIFYSGNETTDSISFGNLSNSNISHTNASYGGGISNNSAVGGSGANNTFTLNNVSYGKSFGLQTGDSPVTISGNTFYGTANGIRYYGENVTLSGIDIGSHNIGGIALDLIGSNITIQHSNLSGNGSGTGIMLSLTGLNITVYNVSIYNRTIGINISSGTFNYSNITQNTIKFARLGFVIDKGTKGFFGSKFFNNTVFNSSGAGNFSIFSCTGGDLPICTIDSNDTITDNISIGILITGGNVAGHVFESNNISLVGIGVAVNSITGNYLTSNNTFKNNIFQDIGTTAIQIRGNDTVFYNNITNSTKAIRALSPASQANISFNLINITQIAAEIQDGSNDSIVYNNTIDNSRLGMNIDGSNNTIWLNMFINSTKKFAESAAGNSWNKTIGGVIQGNWWGDILNGTLHIFDNTGDAFGDAGTDYPYNSSNRARVNGTVQDIAPLTRATSFLQENESEGGGAPSEPPASPPPAPPSPPQAPPSSTSPPSQPAAPTTPTLLIPSGESPAAIREFNLKCWTNYGIHSDDLKSISDLVGSLRCSLEKIQPKLLIKLTEKGLDLTLNELANINIAYENNKPKFTLDMATTTIKQYKVNVGPYLQQCSYFGLQGNISGFCWPWVIAGSLVAFMVMLRFSKRIKYLYIKSKKVFQKNVSKTNPKTKTLNNR